VFEQVVEFKNLLLAARKAFRGKKDKAQVARFYLDLEKELLSLQEVLRTKSYRPQPLRVFTIRDPKERLIGAPHFRDRVVHHAIFNITEPIFERRFIFHSYACRAGKGTHRAIRQAQRFCRDFSFFLKLDIRKCFETIDHQVLKDQLSCLFRDTDLLWLLFLFIDVPGDPKTTQGIPIGSLTSQHFANFYLDRLDHFVKDELGVRAYLRYMDDFVLFSDRKVCLRDYHDQVSWFLKEQLKLRIKEEATALAPVSQGLPFLGFRIYPALVRIRRENKRRLLKKMKLRAREFSEGKIDEERFARSLMSITQHLKTSQSHMLRRDIFEEMFP